MNVKGTKNELLRHVSFPSYVQGMCILSKHIDICQTGRKTKAFDSMDELQFKGDIQQYQIEAVSKIQELFDSKANIVDYALSKVMKSFEGKSKTIQYRIADDINNTQDTGFDKLKVASTPIDKEIDPDSPALSYKHRRKFMTAVGCLVDQG